MSGTSNREITAKRVNAGASTGPKTKQGRIRSAQNALRHALSVPIYSDPALSEEVEALAREIAGKNTNPEIQVLARRVAEAQIDLRCVRNARHQLLSKALSNPHCDSRSNQWKRFALTRPLAASIWTRKNCNKLTVHSRVEIKQILAERSQKTQYFQCEEFK
jgi:hypothetical protein